MKTFKITFVFVVAMLSLGFAQTPAIKTEITGKGNPVLFLPGFTTPGSIWKETVNNINPKVEAHLISYAGFNGNPPIEMPWYATIKKELITYIKNKQLTNLKIVGHSMGGNIAVDLATELPDIITGILIVDAIPCMRELMMPGVPDSQIQYDNPYNKQMLEMPEEQFKQNAIMMAQNMTNTKDKVETLTQWILEADRKTYVYGYTDLLKLDLRPILNKVTAKTLILGASFPNAEVAKSNYEKQYTNLSNKTIEMVPDSKHFIMFDQSEWFYKKTNDFLTNE